MDANPIPTTPDALKLAVSEAQNSLRRLRFQVSANQLKQVREIRSLRTRLARLQTALTVSTT